MIVWYMSVDNFFYLQVYGQLVNNSIKNID